MWLLWVMVVVGAGGASVAVVVDFVFALLSVGSTLLAVALFCCCTAVDFVVAHFAEVVLVNEGLGSSGLIWIGIELYFAFCFSFSVGCCCCCHRCCCDSCCFCCSLFSFVAVVVVVVVVVVAVSAVVAVVLLLSVFISTQKLYELSAISL